MREATRNDTQPRRGTTRVLVIVLAAVVLSVVTYLWYQQYKTSPAYSLALLVDASQRKDSNALNDLIAADQVVDNYVHKQASGIIGSGGSSLLSKTLGGIETLAPQARQSLNLLVRDAIAEDARRLASSSESTPFLLTAFAVPRAVKIQETGEVATVTVSNADHPVELTMRRRADHWSVIAVRDDALASRIAAKIGESLPAFKLGF